VGLLQFHSDLPGEAEVQSGKNPAILFLFSSDSRKDAERVNFSETTGDFIFPDTIL